MSIKFLQGSLVAVMTGATQDVQKLIGTTAAKINPASAYADSRFAIKE